VCDTPCEIQDYGVATGIEVYRTASTIPSIPSQLWQLQLASWAQ